MEPNNNDKAVLRFFLQEWRVNSGVLPRLCRKEGEKRLLGRKRGDLVRFRTVSLFIIMKQYIVQGGSGGVFTVFGETGREVMREVERKTGIPLGELRLTQGNKDIEQGLREGITVWMGIRGVGGKGGGFGTLLRGQGMIVRVDNFEDCRDLNGRRIRDVNNEIRLKEWEKKKQEDDKIIPSPQPPVPYKASTPVLFSPYHSQVQAAASAMSDAVRAGLRKRKPPPLPQDQPTKRPNPETSVEK